jgi:hypothetical protein
MTDEYLNMSKAPELLPDHLATPEGRQQHEAEARQSINRRLNEIQREINANPEAYRLKEGADTVWVQNLRPRAKTIGNVVVPGELDEEADGPFTLVRQSDIDANMRFAMMFESSEADPDHPPALRKLSREQYQAEYRKYLERRKSRGERFANREMTEAEKERRDDFTVRRGVLVNQPIDQS